MHQNYKSKSIQQKNNNLETFKRQELKYQKLLNELRYRTSKQEDLIQDRKTKEFTVIKYKSDIPEDYRPSLGEQRVREYLIENKIEFLQEVRFERLKKLRFDFYLPKLHICIEYDGKQHFEYAEEFDKGDKSLLLKRKKYDKAKNIFCKEYGLRLIRINYKKLNVINKSLGSLLHPKMIKKLAKRNKINRFKFKKL